MRTIISLRVTEGVRMALVDNGKNMEWRFASPVDEHNSIIPERNSPEELALVMSLTVEEKKSLLQTIERVSDAYDLLLTGKAMRGLNAFNI